MENIDDKILQNAQYRKSLSIAYFNAINAAIELVKKITPELNDTDVKHEIVNWRNFFLEEHKKYYATVIANIGVNYRADETIAKLKKVESLEGLKNAWLALSEDERRDGEIIKVKNELKEKYEKK